MQLPNLAYHLALAKGRGLQRLYRMALPSIVQLPIELAPALPATVYSFSCERDLAEQVACIRSFLKHVGVPLEFIVVSDGSIKPASAELIAKMHSCVRVVELESTLRKDLPDSLLAYAQKNPGGKKLALLVSLPINGPTIFVDSDVLFFPAARELCSLVSSTDRRPRYLLDCQIMLDTRMLDPNEEDNPLNSGLIVIFEKVDWTESLRRLERVRDNWLFYSEQTAVHIALNAVDAVPLPADKYVVSLEDQTQYADAFLRTPIAMRHYCGPTRHKFWGFLGL